MNVLSLFDGISCGYLALQRAGIKFDKYFASEIDKCAIAVSKYNFSDIVHLGDVKNVEGEKLPKIDLLIGGSPCQGFSMAGKRLNFNDPRSKLFFEFVRILKEIKPKYFLLENVVMKKEWQDIISKYLGVEPIMINSALVSAQNRKRLYWTNIPIEGLPDDKGILLKDILENVEFRDIPNFLFGKCGNTKRINICNWVNKKKSNTITTVASRPAQYLLNENKTKCRLFTINEAERLQTLPDNFTKYGLFDDDKIKEISKTQRYRMLGNGWTVDVIAWIFSFIK